MEQNPVSELPKSLLSVGRKYGRKIGGTKWKQHPKLCLKTRAIVQTVDLRSKCPPVYDQGNLGACTANGLAALYEFDELKQHNKSEFTPSRLFIYYNERKIEGTVNEDAGAEIKDGIDSIQSTGVCPEPEWPYDVTKFTVQPPASCYTDAQKYKSLQSHAIAQDFNSMYNVLASGIPFAAGIVVYSSFESDKVAKTGKVPMPGHLDKVLGGHVCVIVGYSIAKNRWICRNSWGPNWGMNGYFTLPKAYLLSPKLADEFWCIGAVSNN